jgi:hypothetical protein
VVLCQAACSGGIIVRHEACLLPRRMMGVRSRAQASWIKSFARGHVRTVNVDWQRVEEALGVARAADDLLRKGAKQAALVLYRELPRFDDASEGASSVRRPADVIHDSRAAFADWLERTLQGDLSMSRRLVVSLRVALALALGVAIVVGVAWTRPPGKDIGGGARWSASSARGDAAASGTLPEHGWFFSPPSYFFHTNADKKPWLLVALGGERRVTAVRIVNRLDCCRDRADDIRIEVGADTERFETVSKRTKEFRSWLARFPARRARFVRVLGKANEPLHLADLQVFGS